MTEYASPDRRTLLGLGASAAVAVIAWRMFGHDGAEAVAATPASFKLTDAEWHKRLSPQAYNVLRQAATEFPYSSPLNNEHRKGSSGVAPRCRSAAMAGRRKWCSG